MLQNDLSNTSLLQEIKSFSLIGKSNTYSDLLPSRNLSYLFFELKIVIVKHIYLFPIAQVRLFSPHPPELKWWVKEVVQVDRR